MMKRYSILFAAIAAIMSFGSCQKDTIKSYSVENCAVNFESRTNTFSLKGISDDKIRLNIPVKLVGPPVEYDREITVEVKDSSAVLGRDFTIVSSVISADTMRGAIEIEVNKLTEDVSERACVLYIKPNDSFRAGVPDYQKTIVKWTELYARPTEGVWRYWFLYICPAYSQNLHRLIVEEFGLDAERYTLSQSYVKNDPTLIFKSPSWWYSADRQLLESVSAHDAEHPDDPYRHSADYELFKSYTIPVGEGQKAEGTPPTILETLRNL